MPQKVIGSGRNTLILAVLIGLSYRLLFLPQVPGIHFDEAWAAGFAAKIAFKSGFWPIDAMSPYTHPWSHYLTALFFKLLGPHLWVSRLAGILMSGFGIVLIAKALAEHREKQAMIYFACLAATCMGSIFNERFTIELNTFHVLCLGGFAYGWTTRRWPLIAVASFFGVTSHVLFVAPALAAFLVWVVEGEYRARDRAWIAGISAVLLPFFVSIYFQIPEKGKAISLILIDLLIIIYCIRPLPIAIGQLEKKIRLLLSPVAALFLVVIWMLMEGDLAIAFTHGKIFSDFISILCIIVWGFAAIYLSICAWKVVRNGSFPRSFAIWALYTLIFISLISTKPAPRYFEMAFILILVSISLVLARLPEKAARTFILILALVSCFQWRYNYIVPGLLHEGVDRSFRYLFFHDNSSDSLPKQNLVDYLAELGCRPEQVQTTDPRLREALDFLRLGDWNLNLEKKCPYRQVNVERAATSDNDSTGGKASSGAAGVRFEEFVLH